MSLEPKAETLWILTNEFPEAATSPDTGATPKYGGFQEYFVKPDGSKLYVAPVPVDRLETEMIKFLGIMERIFALADAQGTAESEDQGKKRGGLQLDEIELSITINGKGEIKVFGAGGEVGGSGAIRLKYKRVSE